MQKTFGYSLGTELFQLLKMAKNKALLYSNTASIPVSRFFFWLKIRLISISILKMLEDVLIFALPKKKEYA